MSNMLHTKLLLSSTALLMTISHSTSAFELGLKPISDPNGAYQLARVCFLPDCEDDASLRGEIEIDINIDSKKCENKGFTYYPSGCPDKQDAEKACDLDSEHYLKCTPQQWCKNNNYNFNSNNCKKPKYLLDQCNGLDFYKHCEVDYARACKEENSQFTNSCSSGWQVDPNNKCSYNSSYGKCCNLCSDYPYTSATVPSGYELAESCTSCNGTRYKIRAKACSGYQTCGAGCTGYGGSCQSGSTLKYSSCQCDPCPGYYSCGGSWQYCTGSKCSADSSKCNVYCASDYFPNSCSDSSYCDGVYRNGYCSGSCNVPSGGGSGSSGDGSSCDHYGSGYTYCCDTNLSYDYSFCRRWAVDCSSPKNACISHGGTWSFVRNVTCGGGYDGYAEYHCSAGSVW